MLNRHTNPTSRKTKQNAPTPPQSKYFSGDCIDNAIMKEGGKVLKHWSHEFTILFKDMTPYPKMRSDVPQLD